MKDFVGFGPKMYSYIKDNNNEDKKGKVPKKVLQKDKNLKTVKKS